MAPQDPARQVDDLARRGRAGPQPLDDVGIAPLRHEADVLAVGLLRHRQAEAGGMGTHLRLRHPAQREAQEAELLGGGGEQEIALVAAHVAPLQQAGPRGPA